VRISASRCVAVGALLTCCVLLTSCAAFYQFSGIGSARPGPPGVEFVGVYQDRAELVPGLRGARTLEDFQQLLDESDKPGGTNIRARFRVVRVLSDSGGHLSSGDRVTLVFRSPTSLHDPGPLPERLLGRTLHVIMHDPFRRRYYGRFSYFEWRENEATPRMR
jgi:hypothetical protein